MIVYFSEAVWQAIGPDKARAIISEQQETGNATIYPNAGAVPISNLLAISDAVVAENEDDPIVPMSFRLGLEIYYLPQLPSGKHITEMRSPIQALAFRQALGQMYRTHLRKNADYSPANILGTGFVGLVTRLWDKVARLMNLAGFTLKIEAPGTYTAPRQASNESIEDTLMDSAVYSIIGLLLLRGEWGK